MAAHPSPIKSSLHPQPNRRERHDRRHPPETAHPETAQHRCPARLQKHQQPHAAAGRPVGQRMRHPFPAQIGRHRPDARSTGATGCAAGTARRQPARGRTKRPLPAHRSRFVFGQRRHSVPPAHRRLGRFGRRIPAARRGTDARTPDWRFGRCPALGRRAHRLFRQRRLSAAAHSRTAPDRRPHNPHQRQRVQPIPHRAAHGAAAHWRHMANPSRRRTYFQAVYRHHIEFNETIRRKRGKPPIPHVPHPRRQPLPRPRPTAR